MKILLLFLLFFSLNVEAYVLSRGIGKSFVRWGSLNPTLKFYLNTANDDNLSDSEVTIITNDSKNEWDDNSNVNIIIENTTGEPGDAQNDIYFSSDPYFFNGSGIVGLTLVSFREDSGAIIETDIVLNDLLNFKDRSSLLSKLPSEYFLGNVLTHELGHTLGLSHSEIHRSTMFYKLANGQSEISEDDRSGVNIYYPLSSYTGIIRGNTFGGSSMIGIFGVQVQAIAASTGVVMGATISEEDGSFIISGLPKNQQYYLYISPVKNLASIPLMYNDVRKNFCNSNTDFRGSFYSSCFSSDRGYPLGIDLTDQNSNINVGHVSIKCGLEVPVEYFLAKDGGIFELNVLDIQGNAGNAFVGFFSDSEVENNEEDNIEIDLRSLNVTSNDIYLDLKVVHQNFFSELKLNMDVTFSDNSIINYPVAVGLDGVVFDQEKNIKLDIHTRLLLDSVDFSRNIFQLAINPREFIVPADNSVNPPIAEQPFWLDGATITSPDFSILSMHFFQELEELGDNQKFYFLIANISQKNLDGTYTIIDTKRYNLTDNVNCPDAPSSYTVKASLYKETPSQREIIAGDDPLGLACGTIDIDNDDQGNGTMMLTLFGLLCAALLVRSYQYLGYE
ncbi:MAG: matrixin family metalloprotease [Bacteriovoracaceae bacterium]|jgi:hypothetical protein|nr:matrixin family metalloprotease [Bacteriovoracaceae bacterium]